MSETDDQKLDLASVFPAKGDSRRPPDWWGRALLYTVIAVFAAIFVWTSWGKISTIVLDVVISIFIALAVEPLVVSMVRHGWTTTAIIITELPDGYKLRPVKTGKVKNGEEILVVEKN